MKFSISILYLCLLTFFMPLCASDSEKAQLPMPLQKDINSTAATIAVSINNANYGNALKKANPSLHIVEQNTVTVLRFLGEEHNFALYDVEAIQIVNNFPEYTFTPHYIETVVIAIDRDQTLETINGWKDLLESNSSVNFSFGKSIAEKVWNSPENYHIVTSMAKALYGSYDIKAIAKDFKNLYINNRFFSNDNTQPLSVLHESEATRLIQEGRNLEIIFPKEGTQSFVAGVLHKDTINFNTSLLNKTLHENGFRLINDISEDAYPTNETYNITRAVENYTDYNKAIASLDSIMRRDSFNIKRYGLANQKERTTAYIVCIIIVVAYLLLIIMRVTNYRIRNALVLICSLELLLASTQYIKSIVSNSPNLETFLWYAFYFPFTMMPAIFVYVAVITGRTSEKKHIPVLYTLYFFASWLPILFVATNNIHGQVFTIYNHVHTYFDYNWGYYAVMGWIYLSLMYAITVLIYKSFQSPRKWAFILPVFSSILAVFYTVGVVLRIPIARDFDIGYGTGIVLLLFIEACIQSRLFPINRGHKKLFSNSSLQMEIKDDNNDTILHSDKIKTIGKNYILKESPIHGGSFLFYEDYTTLNETREKRAQKNKQLYDNNLLLEEKSKVESNLAVLSVQKEVYKNIDRILQRDTKKISQLLETLTTNKDISATVTHINVIACGIKRECILRINHCNNQWLKVYDFLSYINEMSEFTLESKLTITMSATVDGELPSEQALLMYKIFRVVVEESFYAQCKNLLIQLYCNKEDIVLSFVTNRDISNTINAPLYTKEAKALGGNFEIKPWDDTNSFLVSFKKGDRILC